MKGSAIWLGGVATLLGVTLGCGKTGDTPLPVTAEDPKVRLGRELFFDPRLSRDGTISCNSCHNVMSGGTDNRAVSVGIGGKTGARSAPTVWNAAFNAVQFWDGRAATLEEQAKGPLVNPIEMGMESHDAVVKRVASIRGYVEEFKRVYGDAAPLTIDAIAGAIAAYERTLVTVNSPFDRYRRGDKTAISPQAERGYRLVEQIGCTMCHSGTHFNGGSEGPGRPIFERFPERLADEYVAKYRFADDLGLGALTKKPDDNHRWKVPTWRNVALTAPYFHNGAVATLDEAVRVMAKVQLDIVLTEPQVQDIVAFLTSLTGEFPKQTLPRLPDTPGTTPVGP